MRFIKAFYVSVLLIFIPYYLTADDTLLVSKPFEGTQKVEFRTHGRDHYKITNMFLQKISEANNRLRVFTSYDIHYAFDVRIFKAGEDASVISIYLSDISTKGDVFYRDFRIEDILIPSKLMIELELSLGKDSLDVQFDMDIPRNVDQVKLLQSKVVEFCVETHRSDEVDVSLSNYRFYYDELAVDIFQMWEEAYFSYYESDRLIDLIEERIEGLEPGNPDRLILDEFRFCEAERMFWQAYHAPFRSKLSLSKFDPAGFQKRFLPLEDSIKKYRNLFNLGIRNIDSLYYLKGLELLKDEQHLAAIEQFDRAIIFNPVHIPSHLSKAHVFLSNGQLDEASLVINKVFFEIHPRGVDLDSAIYYADKVFIKYFDAIDVLNEEGSHTEALALLEKVSEINNKIPAIDYGDAIHKRFANTHTGVYDSYLEVIGRALTITNHSYAKTYIAHAIGYLQEHGEFINGGDRVFLHLEHLIDKLISGGQYKYVMMDFRGAEVLFEEALSLCIDYPAMKCERNLPEYLELAGRARKDVEGYYADNNIKELGIEHRSLFELMKTSPDQGLIIYGVSYYAGKGLHDEAFDLLSRLKEMGVERDRTATVQEYAGKMAANHYAVSSPESLPREIVKDLTGNDRWFRYYSRAFLSSWVQ